MPPEKLIVGDAMIVKESANITPVRELILITSEIAIACHQSVSGWSAGWNAACRCMARGADEQEQWKISARIGWHEQIRRDA